MPGNSGSHRVFTVPNAFTGLRLACLPLFVWLLRIHHPHLRYQAAGLLAVLGTTDWVDGYLARRLHQVSDVGKVLDPVADRLLLLVGVGLILADGSAPLWVGVLALGRELLVAAATLTLAALGARRIDVSWWGKAGTFGLMVAFPLFLTSHSTANWARLAGRLAWVAAVPGLVCGLWSLVLYVPIARRALADGRSGRLAVPDGAGTRVTGATQP